MPAWPRSPSWSCWGSFFWQGWLFWALIVTLIGLRHPPIFEEERLDRRRKILAAVALLIFLVSFTPAPLAARPMTAAGFEMAGGCAMIS